MGSVYCSTKNSEDQSQNFKKEYIIKMPAVLVPSYGENNITSMPCHGDRLGETNGLESNTNKKSGKMALISKVNASIYGKNNSQQETQTLQKDQHPPPPHATESYKLNKLHSLEW
jgi:hypothetical protein